MNRLESRLYPLLVASLSVALMACGGALLLWMMATTIGPFEFLSERGLRTAPPALFVPAGGPVGSEGRADAWRKIWPTIAGESTPLEESGELAQALGARTPLVVIPDARGLAAGELGRLEGFVRGGGSAVVAGAIGAALEGRPEDRDAMRALLRVDDVERVAGSASRALYGGVRGPLNDALFPGRSIRLREGVGAMAVSDPESELRWSAPGAGAASRRMEIGAGRLVWLAVGPQSSHRRDRADRDALHATLRDAVAWARFEPSLSVLPWPRGAAFAGKVELDRRGPKRPTEGLQEELLRQLEAARNRAEHVVVRVPVASLGEDEAIALARSMDEQLKQRGAWIADRDRVREWARARGQVATSLQAVGPNRLLVRVTNRGRGPIEDVGLRVRINRPVSEIALLATELGQRVPPLRDPGDASGAEFVLGRVEAGQSLGLTIDYRPIGG